MDEFYVVNQDGMKSSSLHIFFEEYPSIKLGQEKMEKKTVPGRGNVWLRTWTYSDTEIHLLVDVNAIGADIDRMTAYTEARRFFRECKTISFCDAPDFFYKVKCVELDGVDQYTEDGGDFAVELICEAGVFLTAGAIEYNLADVLQNLYDLCHPEYRITGEGVCVLTVNGKEMTANVSQNLTINTDLMIAYRTDGTMQNMEVTGDYSDLYLRRGGNTISVTEGFELKVVPNWRCL